MQEFLNLYCGLWSYPSCSAMSTFEALVLFAAFAVLFASAIRVIRFVLVLFLAR